MASPGFWTAMVRDLTGHGIFGGTFQFRYILQPVAAIILGARIAVPDGKHCDPLFFKALKREMGQCGSLLVGAGGHAVIPLVVAFIIDSILQHMINPQFRPLESLIVGGVLVFLPFLIVRGLANRIW